MIDKDAIQALQKAEQINAAGKQLNNTMLPTDFGASNNGMLALPDDFKLHDLERMLANRRRARGQMNTSCIDSFAAYTRQHAEDGAAIFVNPSHMHATAVLNLGTPTQPGHADNTATLTAKKTAAYIALLNMTNANVKQSAVAEWLEDWEPHIICFDKTDKMPTALAAQAVRNLTIDTARKLQSTVEQLSSSHSSFESIKASSASGAVPDTIYFTCDPYAGLNERQFVLRLGVLTSDNKPVLTLRIIKAEQHIEEMAQELADKVADAIAPTMLPPLVKPGSESDAAAGELHIGEQIIPVLIGSYSAAT
jgi:uncharacterized protein YfdQ (DUF2303 family)